MVTDDVPPSPRDGARAHVPNDDGPPAPSAPAELAAARAVCSALDPVLTRHGFAPGQPGTRDGEASVVHCCAYGDFRHRFPALAPGIEEASGFDVGAVDPATACVDLDVVVVVDPEPRLTAVRLEGDDLLTLLHDADLPHLVDEARRLPHESFPVALRRLAALLEGLLGRAATR
ncbi:MAG: hypothetical protein H5T83_13525 [Actinotalea sp.]|nr:hypothetical protein [Actinotalea sp.]